MSEKVITCDTVIVGAGSAGLEAFKTASSFGGHCILVESGPLGTSAKRVGDTPISTLFEAAKTIHSLKNLKNFGLDSVLNNAKYQNGNASNSLNNFNIVQSSSSNPALMQIADTNLSVLDNTATILEHVRSIRTKDTSEILSFIYRIPEANRLIGKATFVDDHHLRVNESHIVHFNSAVIATGSAPMLPFEFSQYGQGQGIYTTNEIFEIETLPNSMAIFGSTKEGLQIGQALSYLGVNVVVFGQHRIWKLTDESVIEVAIDAFKSRFDLVLDGYMTTFEKIDNGYGIYYLDNSNYENFIWVESILASSMRYPKIEGLNLREIGINISRNGCINVEPYTMRTNLDHIFAAGEVTDVGMTTADAVCSGYKAGLNAAHYPQLLEVPNKTNVNVLYTEPELAIVGLTYDEVKLRSRKGNSFIASEVRSNDGIFLSTHHDGGILRMYTDEQTRQILGAEICMYRASHIANYLALAISQQMTIDALVNIPFFTPSYEEVVRKACLSAIRSLERKCQNN